MIVAILMVFLIVLTALILLYWVDILSKFSDECKDSDYCFGCKCGFCVENPGSETCKKIRKEHDNLEKLMKGEVHD